MAIAITDFRIFHHPKKKSCTHWQSNPDSSQSPRPSAPTHLLSVSGYLPPLDSSCTWSHTGYGLGGWLFSLSLLLLEEYVWLAITVQGLFVLTIYLVTTVDGASAILSPEQVLGHPAAMVVY